LAELGFQGITVPEEFGGLGLGYLEVCAAAEELGRSLAPLPSLSSVYICTEAIRRFGSPEQKKKWLPGLTSGQILGTWAAAEGAGESIAERIQTLFVSGYLFGAKMPVLDGAVAQVCLVLAKGSVRGLELVLCDLGSPGVKIERIGTIDPSRPASKIAFSSAPADLLGEVEDATAAYREILNCAAVLLAFEQVGAAERALSMSRDYALERYAFGRAIGANQAIKHKLVDVYTKVEIARAHAYYGAWAVTNGTAQLPLAAAGARAAANAAFLFAAQENIQTHGGIGFTWESDCQLFYRRARLHATVLGSSDAWKEQIVRMLETSNET
jgi:acyl-CoA dehydrogenase